MKKDTSLPDTSQTEVSIPMTPSLIKRLKPGINLTGTEGAGWTIFDVTFVRCLTENFRSWCDSFPLTAPYASGEEMNVSYDAVACVQRIDSWIIEARNSTLSVGLLDVLGRGDSVSADVNGKEAFILGLRGQRKGNELGDEQGVQRRLSSANKVVTFLTLYIASTYAWLAVSYALL